MKNTYIYKYKIFMVKGTYKAKISAFTQMMAKLLHPEMQQYSVYR